MPKFRRKPVVIEAEQFLPNGPLPRGVTLWTKDEPVPRDMSFGYVTTIHGQRQHIRAGDWIVPEPDGVHYYPIKPDIFDKTYEPVTEQEIEDTKR